MTAPIPFIVDGHTHITNRVYWEQIDPWQKQAFGFDYASAYEAGVRVVIENVAPYGYANFNYTPKQSLRLIETFLRVIDANPKRMALACTADEARTIVSEGRMAVFLSIESGFDHEGDIDVLCAMYRLGLRAVQFATQTCFNAFADSEAGGPAIWNGINQRGLELVSAMNEQGMLIDITHATPQAQLQIVDASRKPVVCSHTSMQAVSGSGMSDEILKALCAKGGMVGIIGTSSSLSRSYRDWLGKNSAKAQTWSAPITNMIEFKAILTPEPLMHGEFGNWLDAEMRKRHLDAFQPWTNDPDSLPFMATADIWASHVRHVIDTVGVRHVGIGLDLVGGRSCVPPDACGYPALLEALAVSVDPDDLGCVAAENWLRLLGDVL